MVSAPAPPTPTPAELGILRSLWKHGPSTVREVQERLDGERPTGYTTVLKLLQIMTDKGLVRRNESERAHVYEAMAPEAATRSSSCATWSTARSAARPASCSARARHAQDSRRDRPGFVSYSPSSKEPVEYRRYFTKR